MITALRIITEAVDTPISVAEAKAHLRVTYNAEDEYIQSLIAAATDWAQTYTRRILIDTEVSMRMDKFPRAGEAVEFKQAGNIYYVRPTSVRKKDVTKRDKSILLPGGMVTAVNQIQYTDEADALQTLTGATSDTPGTDYAEDLTDDEWAFVYPVVGVGWPAVDGSIVNTVNVEYQVGWSDQIDLPESIRHAIKFKVGDLFTTRAPSNAKTSGSKAAEALLDPYVIPAM